MTKQELRQILMKARTPINEMYINFYLGKIDMFNEAQLQSFFNEYGTSRKQIEEALRVKLEQDMQRAREKKYPLNNFISYGVSGKTIHIHILPKSIREDIVKKGIRRVYNEATLYLVDALEQIEEMSGEQEWEQVYAISPILSGGTLRIFEQLGFETKLYGEEEMERQTEPETQLARYIFPEAVRVGTAKLSIEELRTPEWQRKKEEVKQELKQKGVTILQEEEQEQK